MQKFQAPVISLVEEEVRRPLIGSPRVLGGMFQGWGPRI